MLNIQQINAYYGDSQILEDVSLSVPQEQIVCLLGRNGVGKTTLMKTIMGVVKTRQGKIELDGTDVTTARTSRRAKSGIGYVPQGRGIFPYLSVYENIEMGFEATEGGLVKQDVVEEMYHMFPVLRDMRKRVAGTLSGGQQQQLAIARALASQPKLLLLDEPTEGIQPSIMLEIEEVLLALQEKGGISILLVEQFLDFALAVSDYFYIMETGTIVKEGPLTEFSDDIAKEYLSV